MKQSDPLVVFFYILLRDHLPAGTVELIMRDHVELPLPRAPSIAEKPTQPAFSNRHVEAYAKEIAKRLSKRRKLIEREYGLSE